MATGSRSAGSRSRSRRSCRSPVSSAPVTRVVTGVLHFARAARARRDGLPRGRRDHGHDLDGDQRGLTGTLGALFRRAPIVRGRWRSGVRSLGVPLPLLPGCCSASPALVPLAAAARTCGAASGTSAAGIRDLGTATGDGPEVVPPRGFEPLISTLKGWRPRPLDDGGTGRERGPECTSQPPLVPVQIMPMITAAARQPIAASASSPPTSEVKNALPSRPS